MRAVARAPSDTSSPLVVGGARRSARRGTLPLAIAMTLDEAVRADGERDARGFTMSVD